MGSKTVDSVVKQVSQPDKLIKNAVTGGLYGQADVLSTGATGKGIEENLKGIGGGAKKTSEIDAGLQATTPIDANKFYNAQLGPTPTAQTFTAAPTTIDQGQSNQSREYQDFLAKQLQAQTLGQGPSLAQGQFQQNLDQQLAAQAAMAASARGGNVGTIQRQLAQQQAQTGLQAANQAAQLRMQEQLQAQGLLGQTSGAMRGQDIGVATSQAGLTQQGNIFNAQQQQQGSQFNAQQEAQMNGLRAQYMQMGLSAEQANQAAQNAFRSAQLQQAGINAGINQANVAADNAYTGQIMNTLGGIGAAGIGAMTGGASLAAAPAMAGSNVAGNANTAQQGITPPSGMAAYDPYSQSAMSDKRAKKNIKEGDASVKQFLAALTAHDYEYKNPAHGTGPQTSVMAQDLEKSELGKRMVQEGPDGKMVNYGSPQAQAAFLASMAHLDKRLAELEAKNKKGKEKWRK